MGVTVRLLGPPAVVVDGAPVPGPRGHKAWGLLAFLTLAPAPVPRQRLCALLFPDAEDPQAALRWNLSALRRALGDPTLLRGDPLQPLPAEAVDADVRRLGKATGDSELGGVEELLEGLAFPTCPGFEVWLDAERRHLRGAARALLRERALMRLGEGDPVGAATLAARLVRDDPYQESSHALLVRCLAAAGEGVAAARQVAACRELFRRELGVEPGQSLAAAASTVTDQPVASPAGGRAGVLAQVEAGEAALGAGAVDAGLQCLRRAALEAQALREPQLQAQALTALGTALIHSVRGQDEEGVAALHRALALAPAGATALRAEAARELGYVEFLAARYDRVEPWLGQAERLAGPDPAARAAVLVVRGSSASDTGRYGLAVAALGEAATETSDERRTSYALSMLGRAHLLRGALAEAEAALEHSLRLASKQSWTSFVPWPETFLAEVDLRRGQVSRAEDRLQHAFALGCHIADPCWEGVSARGLGLVRAARGDVAEAVAALLDARARSSRVPDAYVWLDGYVLDALCTVALAQRLPEAGAWARELVELASSSGMRELAVRGLAHRAALGDAAAGAAALAAAAEIDNPALQELVRTRAVAG